MAHILKKGHYFLFRTKDIHSKGLVRNFDFPDDDCFDISVNVTLVRSRRKGIPVKEGFYKRYVDADTSFDYAAYGSSDTYDLSFRIVRFPISDGSYECIMTNLAPDEFPPEQVKLLYFVRWGIEGSFYNITETLVNHTIIMHGGTRHEFKVNFSRAAHICRVFLRVTREKDFIDVMSLLQKN